MGQERPELASISSLVVCTEASDRAGNRWRAPGVQGRAQGDRVRQDPQAEDRGRGLRPVGLVEARHEARAEHRQEAAEGRPR
eukprot:10710319-Alexandrium_andersonii.AAC.1